MPIEPLTLATSIGTLLTTAYKLSSGIYGTVDSIRSAHKHIKAISSDAEGIYLVVGTLSAYLNKEDTAAGVLHDVIIFDLSTVICNTISVLKELQLIVNDFVKGEESGTKIGKWKSTKWTFKQAEIKQWREQLVAHKITLSLAIATANLINNNSTEMTSRRIEREIAELKTLLTKLPTRLHAVYESHADRVIIDNYNSTILRFAHGADSIISEATWERSGSPSTVASSAGITEQTEENRIARSTATVIAAPTVVSDTHKTATSSAYPEHPQSAGKASRDGSGSGDLLSPVTKAVIIGQDVDDKSLGVTCSDFSDSSQLFLSTIHCYQSGKRVSDEVQKLWQQAWPPTILPVKVVHTVYHVRWELPCYIRHFFNQGTLLGDVVSITGGSINAFATSCRDYVESRWPVVGVLLLRAIQATLVDFSKVQVRDQQRQICIEHVHDDSAVHL